MMQPQFACDTTVGLMMDQRLNTPSTTSGEESEEASQSLSCCSTPIRSHSPGGLDMIGSKSSWGASTLRNLQSPGCIVRSSAVTETTSAKIFKARIKNTFIHVDDDDGFAPLLPKRSYSTPDIRDMMEPQVSGTAPSSCAVSSLLAPLAHSKVTFRTVVPSVGSQIHGTGICRPCAWVWKADGCKNGKDCRHCHSCPQGEIKRRRAVRLTTKRAVKHPEQKCVVPACP
jgi:hypothetical protein